MSGGVLSSAAMGEAWAAIRDRARPVDQEEAESLASVLAPPSKAHVKRLKRDRSLFKEPIPVGRQESASTKALRRQLDVKNALIQMLGGSRTIVIR